MGGEKSVRVNLTVPAELKRRMDAASGGVNWSATAAGAFRTKLLDLRAREKVETMQDVIERLKAEAELEANEQYGRGRAAGEEWAKRKAKPSQLRRLDKATRDGVEDYLAVATNGMNGGIGLGLCRDVTGIRDQSPRDAGGFWERVLGDGGSDAIEKWDFARGFIEGALDVWDAVKEQL